MSLNDLAPVHLDELNAAAEFMSRVDRKYPLHQRAADLGGHLRSGLEDTFYLGDGTKVTSNGQLVEGLAACARRAGREIASPAEARQIFGVRH